MGGNKRKRFEEERASPETVRVDTEPVKPSPSSGLTMTQARELVCIEMQTAQTRIDELLSRLNSTHMSPVSRRTALGPASAPSQARAHDITTMTADCTSCIVLQAKLDEMHKQAAVHREERRAWQQFKTWWLKSLSKHQRHRNPSTSAQLDTSVGNSAKRKRHVRTQQDPISHMVAGLDDDARRVWKQAGILEDSVADSEPVLTLPRPVPTDASIATKSPQREDPTSSKPVSKLHVGSPTRKLARPKGSTHVDPPRVASTAIGHVGETPERNRHARRGMIAHDCPDCHLFYSHFDNQVGAKSSVTAATERQACSRHRSAYERATTPQGYWNIGFPTTQDAEEINLRARQQHQ